MMTIIMAAILGALCILCIALAVKKHSSTGKTPVFAVALALIFALVLIVVPFSIHIVNTGEVAVVKQMGEAKDVKTAGMHFDHGSLHSTITTTQRFKTLRSRPLHTPRMHRRWRLQ